MGMRPFWKGQLLGRAGGQARNSFSGAGYAGDSPRVALLLLLFGVATGGTGSWLDSAPGFVCQQVARIEGQRVQRMRQLSLRGGFGGDASPSPSRSDSERDASSMDENMEDA